MAEAFQLQYLCHFKTNIPVSQHLQHSLINVSMQFHTWITHTETFLSGIFDPILFKVHKMHIEPEFWNQIFLKFRKHRFLFWIHTHYGKDTLAWNGLTKNITTCSTNKFCKCNEVSATTSLPIAFPILEERSWFWDICLN